MREKVCLVQNLPLDKPRRDKLPALRDCFCCLKRRVKRSFDSGTSGVRTRRDGFVYVFWASGESKELEGETRPHPQPQWELGIAVDHDLIPYTTYQLGNTWEELSNVLHHWGPFARQSRIHRHNHHFHTCQYLRRCETGQSIWDIKA